MNMMRYFGVVLLALGLLLSCASTGKYKTLESSESVETLGFVQAAFLAKPSESSAKSLNELAYIKLMEEAGKTYSGAFDVVDITWAKGKQSDVLKQNYEYSANGRVIKQ